tara:strand:- start:163 stop:534 length:372 start_codon:yes stop_codon:yes gene_type:complete
MKKTDPDYIAKLEKAIADKYGKETIAHPKADWDDEKEMEYLNELKTNYRRLNEEQEKEEVNGVLISKELLNKKTNRSCPTCNSYSFKSRDDLYMTKFGCCFNCYIQFVEGREERWATGWRPSK